MANKYENMLKLIRTWQYIEKPRDTILQPFDWQKV